MVGACDYSKVPSKGKGWKSLGTEVNVWAHINIPTGKIINKNYTIISFSHHLRHNLAKFQLHSTSRSKSLGKSVFWRYRDFKFRDPFFTKIGPFSQNIFQIPKNLPGFEVFYGLAPGGT